MTNAELLSKGEREGGILQHAGVNGAKAQDLGNRCKIRVGTGESSMLARWMHRTIVLLLQIEFATEQLLQIEFVSDRGAFTVI